MFCQCEGLPHGNDYTFLSLEQPHANATSSDRLDRWASIVRLHPAAGRMDARRYVTDHKANLLRAFGARGDAIRRMMTLYSNNLEDPASPAALDHMKTAAREETTEAIKEICSNAVERFVTCNWSYMTKFDYMMVQNAFQASDSNEFPFDDENLKEIFVATTILGAMFDMCASNVGWRISFEGGNEKHPLVAPV